MSPNKLVSIIIPTYRTKGRLLQAIESARSQTYPNIEIIVVDDNNPHDEWRKRTEEIISSFSDARVKYIRHSQNKNGAAARNTGIKHAHGEYIAFLDDDDYFFPLKIEKQVDYLKRNPQFSAAYCQGEKYGITICDNLKEGNLMGDILLLKSYMYTPSLIFRRNALIQIGGFDESFSRHQDYELLLRFFHDGYTIGAVQECLFGIGDNEGDNIPKSKKYEELKAYFFEKFGIYINEMDKNRPGFKKQVYGKHYAGVFMAYIKAKALKDAFRIFNRYFWVSPQSFLAPIFHSLKLHIKNNNGKNLRTNFMHG